MKTIEVDGLSKIYKPFPPSKAPAIKALKNVNFQVEQETIYTILGPNGAGKTTLIQILAGLIPPTQGEVKISGISIRNQKKVSRKIGLFTSSGDGFWEFMTGWQNLEYFAALQDLVGRDAKKKIFELVELFGMTSYIHHEMHGYSNGMKQRLLLIRALLHNPEILLLDEPISHLDPMAAREFHLLVRNELVQILKKTILISTHQLEEAQEISDTLGFLFKGELLWEKPADFFRLNPGYLLKEYVETVERENECFETQNH